MLIEIQKLWKDLEHQTQFNGRKNIYTINNTMVLDHHALFVYINLCSLGSYHDVSIFRHLTIYQEWHQYFTHWDEYFEYPSGDLKYLGEEMFIMKRMGKQKLPLDVNHGAIQAYNKMHVRFKVQEEWETSGLKSKWRCFMKRFDSTKPKKFHLFQASVILTNYLHVVRSTSRIRSLKIKTFTLLHKGGQEIIRYKFKLAKTYNLRCKV